MGSRRSPAVSPRPRLSAPAAAFRLGPEVISAAQFRAHAAAPKGVLAFDPKAFRALGRLKAGELNKTEARYDAHLRRRLLTGEILWFRWHFITLKLAPSTHFRPDVAVQTASGHLEIHDVKGARILIEDDAAVKMKVAADLCPLTFAYAFPQGKSAECGWTLEYIG